MNNLNGHRERIREKYLKNGIYSFEEYEILELLLTYAIPRKDTKDLSKKLLREFKSLEAIFKADEKILSEIDGLGKSSISFLKLMGELPNLLYRNSLKNEEFDIIKNKEDLIKYLRSKISFSDIERFYVIYLSNSNKVLALEEKSYGTIDKSSVYPREIYKEIIKYNAKAIILSHNHPSGNIKPSRSDIKMTREIAKGLENFDAILLEHIIITKNSYFSFLEEGLI